MRTAPLAALVLLAGCKTPEAARAVVGNAAPLTEAVYPAHAPDAPVTVTTGDLDGPYDELAVVVVRSGPDLSDAEEIAVIHERLRDEARRLGAHAVVRVTYHDVPDTASRAIGTAVRVRDR